ncbi:MAG: hypothetical protein ACE5JA_03170 [bacterium]
MVSPAELKRKFDEFSRDSDGLKRIRDAWKKHERFLQLYPFREDSSRIDELTPDRIYNRGGDYYFKWIEHGLKDIGHISVWSATVWENARNDPERLKELLRVLVDDGKSIAEKIDAPWEHIPRFGGGKQIAKKTLFCYYPKDVIPIFSAAHLEHFCDALELDYEGRAKPAFGREYEELTEGRKFELLNDLLFNPNRLGHRNKQAFRTIKSVDPAYG